MGDDRTTVTETVTGLGMLGFPGITMALRARPATSAVPTSSAAKQSD